MWSLFPGTLAAVALTLAAPAGPSNPSIASIKANPAAVSGRQFEIAGEVVDVRSTSPIEHSGLYRLVDASDTAGVLVQTDDLPAGGGTFRVKAKLAPAQTAGSLLRLVEIQRKSTDGRSLLPLAVLILAVLSVLVLAMLFAQAAREQRQYLLALPLWLLPYAAPTGKTDRGRSDALPALRYEPELETEDRRRHVRLRNRKRALLSGVGASAALAGLSGLWAVSTRPPAPLMPTFLLLGADNAPVPPAPASEPPAPVPEALAVVPDSVADRTPTVPIAPPQTPRSTAAVVKKPAVRDTAPPRRPDAVVPPPKARVAQAAPKGSPPPAPPPQVIALPPPPAPAPPPPAAAPPQETRAAPARNPESDRAEASSTIRDAATHLVSAINARQDAELAQLFPDAQSTDRSRMNRFLKLIKDYGPRATLATVDEPALAGDRGEGRFSLSFSWRGDFGVSSKKTAAFLGTVRRTDGGWRFDGARLLDNLP